MNIKEAQDKLNKRMKKRMIGRSRAPHIVLNEKASTEYKFYLGKRPAKSIVARTKFKPFFRSAQPRLDRNELKLGAV